ncbi:MAG: OPT/YSL family transporter, partial [Candidatus Babeliales bacterium]
ILRTSSNFLYIEWIVVLLMAVVFFSWFNFSIPLQLYLVLFTALCTYQLLVIGGEMGMAPVGRFATFVMMPALFIFKPNYEQLTIISTFVEVCGGVAVDILFGRKLAHLAGIESKKVKAFQWFGLIISSLVVGIIFWILITKFGLGSTGLIAQRSQTRALTIQFQNFDFYAMVLGALYGSLLKEFKVSPIMVLGGILMSMDSVILLILGGLVATLMRDAKEYQVFWSGVFAVNSIVMIITALWR